MKAQPICSRSSVTFDLAVCGARGADLFACLHIVCIDALGPNVLMRCASHNVHALVLGALVVDRILYNLGVVCAGSERVHDIILNLAVSDIETCSNVLELPCTLSYHARKPTRGAVYCVNLTRTE